MQLLTWLSERFENGLDYEDAAELCKGIYSSLNVLPGTVDVAGLSMETIADVFAELSKVGIVKGYASYRAVLYGANYHAVTDKGHWIEIQASILKRGSSYDKDRVRHLTGV